MKDAIERAAERWRLLATVAAGLLASVWFAVTWADDKLRKVERVPAIEEAVLQFRVNEELIGQRIERIEKRQDLIDQKQDAANTMILQRLDKLLEERHVR